MIRGAWGRDPLLPRAFSLMSVGPPAGRPTFSPRRSGGARRCSSARCPAPRSTCSGPLGTSFPEPDADTVDLLVAGGVGLPPLYMQGELRGGAEAGRRAPRCSTAAAARQDLVLLREMEAMGLALHLTTEDGTVGTKGLVTRALEARLDSHRGKRVRVMGCGPNAMLWAVARLARERDIPCFISLEEQMACGIGVCLGCAIPARSRPYRYVCSNGPVFDAADVLDVKPSAGRRRPPPPECPA